METSTLRDQLFSRVRRSHPPKFIRRLDKTVVQHAYSSKCRQRHSLSLSIKLSVAKEISKPTAPFLVFRQLCKIAYPYRTSVQTIMKSSTRSTSTGNAQAYSSRSPIPRVSEAVSTISKPICECRERNRRLGTMAAKADDFIRVVREFYTQNFIALSLETF
jgi:hypothetical protein